MEITVWKFPLPMEDDRATIEMPFPGRPIHVAEQQGEPFVWALVSPGGRMVKRVLRVAGTGHILEGNEWRYYLGSFQMRNGALVFHVFDLGDGTPR